MLGEFNVGLRKKPESPFSCQFESPLPPGDYTVIHKRSYLMCTPKQGRPLPLLLSLHGLLAFEATENGLDKFYLRFSTGLELKFRPLWESSDSEDHMRATIAAWTKLFCYLTLDSALPAHDAPSAETSFPTFGRPNPEHYVTSLRLLLSVVESYGAPLEGIFRLGSANPKLLQSLLLDPSMFHVFDETALLTFRLVQLRIVWCAR